MEMVIPVVFCYAKLPFYVAFNTREKPVRRTLSEKERARSKYFADETHWTATLEIAWRRNCETLVFDEATVGKFLAAKLRFPTSQVGELEIWKAVQLIEGTAPEALSPPQEVLDAITKQTWKDEAGTSVLTDVGSKYLHRNWAEAKNDPDAHTQPSSEENNPRVNWASIEANGVRFAQDLLLQALWIADDESVDNDGGERLSSRIGLWANGVQGVSVIEASTKWESGNPYDNHQLLKNWFLDWITEACIAIATLKREPCDDTIGEVLGQIALVFEDHFVELEFDWTPETIDPNDKRPRYTDDSRRIITWGQVFVIARELRKIRAKIEGARIACRVVQAEAFASTAANSDVPQEATAELGLAARMEACSVERIEVSGSDEALSVTDIYERVRKAGIVISRRKIDRLLQQVDGPTPIQGKSPKSYWKREVREFLDDDGKTSWSLER
jgi:hypothetical protein